MLVTIFSGFLVTRGYGRVSACSVLRRMRGASSSGEGVGDLEGGTSKDLGSLGVKLLVYLCLLFLGSLYFVETPDHLAKA